MMNVPKRAYTIPKTTAKYNGKLKDILTISSRHKTEGKNLETDLANIPLIKQSDNARLLLKYTTILAKYGDDGDSMDDLDQLQQDLEKLLSNSALRIRYLLTEIGEIDRNDGGHDRKDILTISSRHKTEGKNLETDLANIPLIKQSDNARLLLKYTTTKSGDDGVSMDDLDQLQQDLEKLLSNSALRIRYLLTEIGEIDRNDGGHKRKAHDKTSLKRKRPDERPKFKNLKNGVRVVKKHGLTVNKLIGDPHQDIPKVTLPKNDNSDKFWASIDFGDNESRL